MLRKVSFHIKRIGLVHYVCIATKDDGAVILNSAPFSKLMDPSLTNYTT